MEDKPLHKIVVNFGSVTLNSRGDESDVDLIANTAVCINHHLKRHHFPLYTMFIESIDGKPVSSKVSDSGLKKAKKILKQKKLLSNRSH